MFPMSATLRAPVGGSCNTNTAVRADCFKAACLSTHERAHKLKIAHATALLHVWANLVDARGQPDGVDKLGARDDAVAHVLSQLRVRDELLDGRVGACLVTRLRRTQAREKVSQSVEDDPVCGLRSSTRFRTFARTMISLAGDLRGSFTTPLARVTADTYSLMAFCSSRTFSVDASASASTLWP